MAKIQELQKAQLFQHLEAIQLNGVTKIININHDMKLIKRITSWLSSVLMLFLVTYWYTDYHLDTAIDISVLFTGKIWIIYGAISIYEQLKAVKFQFKYIPRKSWFIFIITHIIIWPIFYLLFTEKEFMIAYLFPGIMLPLFLIIDIIAIIGRKIFN